ncbi:MAG: tetratricopeptide repeat protein [Desulfomonilaceae bacterium]
MDAVTYPNPSVVSFVIDRLIPLRVPADDRLAGQFKVKWTPTLVTLDEKGEEHQRHVGFLKPEEFIAAFLLAIGKVYLDTGNFEKAIQNFQEVISNYKSSKTTPEAIYLKGVALYKSTANASHLKEAYDQLFREYPDSEWADRATPYKLLV